MKEKSSPWFLTTREIAVARAISNANGSTIGGLSSITGKSESSVSQTVKGLEEKGFITSRKEGLNKFIHISGRNYALSFSDLLKAEPLIPWEKLISNSSMPILLKRATGEDSFEHGISSTSSWRAIRNLSSHGLINCRSDDKAIPDWNLLRFIAEYSEHVSRTFFLNLLPRDAVIIWRSGFRCLFRLNDPTGEEMKNIPLGALPTALSVYPEYGIQFLTSDSYYYYEPELSGLTLEDAILHTLLIGQESQTYITYAMLLALKAKENADFTLLKSKSQRYGLAKLVNSTASYISSRGKNKKWPFPEWKEFREQAQMYGIVVD